jgi:hypothetical protein
MRRTPLAACRSVPTAMRLLTLAALLACALAAVPIAAGQDTTQTPDPGIIDGSEQRALSGARERWRSQGVPSYVYRLSRNCFCPPTTDVKIVVRNGHAARGTDEVLLGQATVPRLFLTIQRAIDRRVAKLVVTYGQRAVPRAIFVDPRFNVADDEIGYVIRRFAPLKG